MPSWLMNFPVTNLNELTNELFQLWNAHVHLHQVKCICISSEILRPKGVSVGTTGTALVNFVHCLT